jgi:hypothetical protein
MKITTKTLLLAASLTLFTGGYQATAFGADMMGAEKAIAAAKDARKQAISVGGEWRDTGKILGKAEALLKDGKYDEAVAMAEKAEAQAMLGYIQATSQTSDNLHI